MGNGEYKKFKTVLCDLYNQLFLTDEYSFGTKE